MDHEIIMPDGWRRCKKHCLYYYGDRCPACRSDRQIEKVKQTLEHLLKNTIRDREKLAYNLEKQWTDVPIKDKFSIQGWNKQKM